MELKRCLPLGMTRVTGLLIVPYGIETRSIRGPFHLHLSLLIVPYGIETRHANLHFLPFLRF